MENSKIIIAIDGHSSTGKSSFAKLVASKLGYIHIDTGALYRAVTYFAYTNGFINNRAKIDRAGLKATLKYNTIEFKSNSTGKSETYLNGNNIEKQIRTLEISNKVSPVAALPFVREYVDTILHKLGEKKGIVMDGRDIGSAVFPNAELKIFMTASAQIRAERRLNELKEKGEKANFESVLKNIIERDNLDATRAIAPLIKADDALLLDNSNLSIPDELKWLGEVLKHKFNLNLE